MIKEKKEALIYKTWILLFVVFSAAMMIVMPIVRIPDEHDHFRQAFIIADGQWLTSMTNRIVEYPEDISKFDNAEIKMTELAELLKVDFSGKRVALEPRTSTAIYPPISYFPQAIGFKIASLFTNKGLILAYSARIANWLCTFAVLFWALKKIPCYKSLMAFLTLLPMNLQEIISISADGMTTAIVFALVAFVLDAIYRKELFSATDYLTMGLLLLGIVCWKVMYFPMLFLLFLIPVECFSTKKRKRITVISTIVGGGVLLALWGIACYALLFRTAAVGTRANTTVSVLAVFLNTPTDFLYKLLHTMQYNWISYINEIFGKAMSWLNLFPDIRLVYASMGLCVMFVIADNPMELDVKTRFGILVPSCFCILIVFLLLYVWWTPIESAMIAGIQGRYFIPLLLGVLISVKPSKAIGNQLIPILYAATCFIDFCFIVEVFNFTF